MSDAEFFAGGDVAESYDPAAFERFKEKIKKNAQFIAALQKQEKKQKGKDDALSQILLKWIKKNQKRGIMLLVAKLIEFNVPASFILAILILGNDELKAEAGSILLQLEDAPHAAQTALMPQFQDETLPLRIKADIDEWGRGILEAAADFPFRILETTLDVQGNIKKAVTDLAANVLSEFLEMNSVTMTYDRTFQFSEFLLKGILTRVKQGIEQKQLSSAAEAEL